IQAEGLRLFAGLAVIVLGLLLTALVIFAGHNDHGFQAKPPFSWPLFWSAFLAIAGLLWCGGCVGLAAKGILPLMKTGEVTPVRIVVVALVGLVLVALGGLLMWGMHSHYRPADEALRIVWQLLQGVLGGIVLLVGCIMVFRKRGGIVLLHAGIGLLMVNELLVARQAVEWQIFLQEGQTTNYMRDIRTTELAIIDPSDAKTDEQIVIPRRLLLESSQQSLAAAEKKGQPVSVS